MAALRASLGKLTSVRISANTVNELQADVRDVQASLSRLRTDAGSTWSGQISSLNSALTKLQAAAQALAATPGTSSVSGAIAALGGVAAAAEAAAGRGGLALPVSVRRSQYLTGAAGPGGGPA